MKSFREQLTFKFNYETHKRNAFIYLAMLISAVTLFAIIWPVMFATHDDIVTYMTVKNGTMFQSIVDSAKAQGRFGFLVNVTFSYFPYIFDSFVAYKIISYASICFSISTLWFLLYRHVGKKISVLAVLLFLVFAQIDKQHNLLVCYVFFLQIPIGFMLLSIERLLTYYKYKEINALIWSAVFLFIATILYESFLLFSIFLFMVAVLNNWNGKKTDLKSIFFDLRFHIVLMLVYLLLYFLWRAMFPSSYDGVQVEFSSIYDSLRVVLTFALGGFPLMAAIRGNIDVSLFEIGFFIKGFVAAIAIVMIIKKAETIKTKFAICIIFLSVLGMLLPGIFHAITPKYVEWVKSGAYGYVSSFYSYFFIVTLLSVITITLYQSIKYKRILLLLIFVVVFSGSLLTDLNNKYYANIFEKQFNRYKTFDKAVSSRYFSTIENGSDIYIPDYIGINTRMSLTNDYAEIYTDNNFTLTNKIEELKFDKPTYVLKYDSSSGTMLMGRINSAMRADEIGIISLTPLNGKSLILNKDTVGVVNVNNVYSIEYERTALIPLALPDDNAIINSHGVDILNSRVLNESINSNGLQSITWTGGFYTLEGTQEFNWRWCSAEGQLILTNNSSEKKRLKLSMGIATGYPEQAKLTIESDLINDTVSINNVETIYAKDLIVPPGNYVIEFKCDAERVNAPSDSRDLVFRVNNLKISG